MLLSLLNTILISIKNKRDSKQYSTRILMIMWLLYAGTRRDLGLMSFRFFQKYNASSLLEMRENFSPWQTIYNV
jgi:hypothetical protein